MPPEFHSRASNGGDRPWWLFAFLLLGIGLAGLIAANDLYGQIFAVLAKGIGVTIFVTLTAFSLALGLGLVIALCGMSQSVILRQTARFYVEIVRGIPIIVLLFYVAFVGVPAFVAVFNGTTAFLLGEGAVSEMQARDVSLMWRAIIALMIAYSAFIAEILRAGIEAVERGQIEAAKALGLNRFQRFRLVVLPQAVKIVFPPLSNDFVSMVKDSSLVSVLGVTDITQMAKVYAAGSFRFFETYSIVTYIYLLLTIGLSLLLRRMEVRMRVRNGAQTHQDARARA